MAVNEGLAEKMDEGLVATVLMSEAMAAAPAEVAGKVTAVATAMPPVAADVMEMMATDEEGTPAADAIRAM